MMNVNTEFQKFCKSILKKYNMQNFEYDDITSFSQVVPSASGELCSQQMFIFMKSFSSVVVICHDWAYMIDDITNEFRNAVFRDNLIPDPSSLSGAYGKVCEIQYDSDS